MASICPLASSRSNGNRVGVAGDVDVMARGARIKTRALQLREVVRDAEGLLVEDQFGDPALEIDAGGDARRASHGNL